MSEGKFIVLEGIDGAGKATQCQLVTSRLRHDGYVVETVSAPQYGKKSAGPVEEYIKGAYGPMNIVSPSAAALLFTVDHFDMGFKIKRALEQGKIVLADRYVPSNIAYQSARIANPKEREIFSSWIREIEYTTIDLPRPDLVLFIRVPPTLTAKLSKKRAEDGSRIQDQYERDLKFQSNIDMMYMAMAEKDPTIKVIDCTPGGVLLPVEQINDLIFKEILRIL